MDLPRLRLLVGDIVTWICPYCGATNYREPCNSRDEPKCANCERDYIDPDLLQGRIERDIASGKEFLSTAKHELQEVDWHIISLKDEISSWEIKRRDAQKDVTDTEKEITKLENTKIFREGDVDREAKARLDRHQVTLPFEVSA